MFFKAVDKFTGAVVGIGKYRSQAAFEHKYNLLHVDCFEISEHEWNQLYFEDNYKKSKKIGDNDD